MTILARLTFVVTVVLGVSWVLAAPPGGNGPRVSGNRPVVIDVPIPEPDEPADGQQNAAIATLPQAEAQPGSKTEGGRTRTPAQEMKRARDLLLKQSSVQAQLVETVTVLDRSYKAEGRYLQMALKPNEWFMRLEMALKVGDAEGTLLEVCDGDVLWTSSQIDAGKKTPKKDRKEQTVTRRNVNQILTAARKLGEQQETSMIANLGLGGLPALLAALEREMKFTASKEDTLRERPVMVIQGTWGDAFAQRFRGSGGKDAPVMYPPFVPDAARIYVDRETGFPHRIMYLKKLTGREVMRPMLTLDFLQVQLGQPIDKSEFAYKPPPGVQEVELTNYFVDQLTGGQNPAQSGGPPK